jgi:hypothetical protein
MDFFKPYKAILVNNLKWYRENIPNYLGHLSTLSSSKKDKKVVIIAGTEIYIGMKPNGYFFLSLSDKMSPLIGQEIELNDFSFI